VKVHHWPTFNEDYQYYVRDNQGLIWFADTQFGDGVVTAVTSKGALTVGLNILRDLRGPLHILKDLGPHILNQLPTIEPKPRLTKAQQEIIARTEADLKEAQS
jgi:hypothetical protein